MMNWKLKKPYDKLKRSSVYYLMNERHGHKNLKKFPLGQDFNLII